MSLSIGKLLLILLIVLLIFGAAKLPRIMGDIGKGVRNLKEGLKGEDEPAEQPKTRISAGEDNRDSSS